MNEKDHKDFLSGLRREEPFHVPDGYFDELPGRIQDRIQAYKPHHHRALRVRPVLAYALGIVLLVVTGVFVTRTLLDSRSPSVLSSTEIAEFVEYFSSDFEEDLILEFMEDESPAGNFDPYEESIIEYLLDENIELESIVDEL